jgi:hypothetical protein
MRVAVSGTTCQDKSTLVQDIITNWDGLYREPKVTYQSIIDSIKGTEFKKISSTMWRLITDLNREIYKFKEEADNVVFNRCALDVLAYSLWLKKKNVNSVDDKFIKRLKVKTRKCMKHLDIIFFVPIVDQQNIHITSKHENITDADISSIREIDAIFKSFIREWRDGKNEFMPINDAPAIIEVFGSREERMKMVSLYIQPDGTQYETSGNFMEDASNILNEKGVPAIKDGKYTQDEHGIILNNLNEEV